MSPPLNAVGDIRPELLNDDGAASAAGADMAVGGFAAELEGGDTKLLVPPTGGVDVDGAVVNRPGGGPNPTGLFPGIAEGLNKGGGATAGGSGWVVAAAAAEVGGATDHVPVAATIGGWCGLACAKGPVGGWLNVIGGGCADATGGPADDSAAGCPTGPGVPTIGRTGWVRGGAPAMGVGTADGGPETGAGVDATPTGRPGNGRIPGMGTGMPRGAITEPGGGCTSGNGPRGASCASPPGMGPDPGIPLGTNGPVGAPNVRGGCVPGRKPPGCGISTPGGRAVAGGCITAPGIPIGRGPMDAGAGTGVNGGPPTGRGCIAHTKLPNTNNSNAHHGMEEKPLG